MGNGVKYETEIRRIGEFQTSDMQAMFDIVHNMQRRHQVLLVESCTVVRNVTANHFDSSRI